MQKVNLLLLIVCRCEWLFVAICQSCDELATYPAGCTPLLPNDSWDRRQPPHDPEKDKVSDDG